MSAAPASSSTRRPDAARLTALRWGTALAALLTAAIAAAFATTYAVGSEALSRTSDAALMEQLELLASRPPGLIAFMVQSRADHRPPVVTRVGLFDPEGRRLAGDIMAVPPRLEADGAVREVQVAAMDGTGEALRVAARRLADGRLLIVARGVAVLVELRSMLIRCLLAGLVAAAAVSLALGAAIKMRADRRLRRLHDAARRIREGALGERLPVTAGGDALDALSSIVNRILDRLEELVDEWKHIGEAIAHETRTPLTAVRARLSRARDDPGLAPSGAQAIDGALAGIDRALTSMTALLRIAEIQRDRRVAGFERFDLAAVALACVDDFQPLAEDAGVALTAATSGPAPIVADRDLLVEVVVNLIDNAIKYAGSGHSVRVSVTGSAERPELCIADDGPGISPEDRRLVFRRFHRSAASQRTRGNGLGLTLVHSICKLHKFDIRLLDANPGCRVTISCWTGSDAQA